jgi:hypothetical protein
MSRSVRTAGLAFVCLALSGCIERSSREERVADFQALERVSAGLTTGEGVPDLVPGGAPRYPSKLDVYLDAKKLGATLPDGSYFFAVLTPAAAGTAFLDGGRENLSDVSARGGDDLGSGDLASSRRFTVREGAVHHAGAHAAPMSPSGNESIQLFPFDDTSDPAGGYLVAVCPCGASRAADCRVDAFFVQRTPPARASVAGIGRDLTSSLRAGADRAP